MNDRKLVELLLDYGKITYGMAYISLCSKNIIPNYENLKKEIKSIVKQDEIAKHFKRYC